MTLGHAAVGGRAAGRLGSRVVGGPEVSTAIVQVKQNGAYAVNSWVVQ